MRKCSHSFRSIPWTQKFEVHTTSLFAWVFCRVKFCQLNNAIFENIHQSEKSPSENLDLWTYKTKDSFFCYASDISCVQRAFWAQLVETVEVPFNGNGINCHRLNKLSSSCSCQVHVIILQKSLAIHEANKKQISTMTVTLYLMKLIDVRQNTNEHRILYKPTWDFI